MFSENLGSQFEQPQSPAAIPQAPAEQPNRPRKKRQKSIIKHSRNVNADIVRAKADANRKVFDRVFLLYAELRGSSPIGACNIDPTGRRNGISFSGVEFLSDVDLCVKATLRSHEREKFYQLIQIELEDLSEESRKAASSAIGVTPVLTWRLSQRLGRAFLSRQLDPPQYFKNVRRKKCDEQPRVRTVIACEETAVGLSAAQVHQPAEFDAGDFENGYQIGMIEPQQYE
jgi:hypothetical protein